MAYNYSSPFIPRQTSVTTSSTATDVCSETSTEERVIVAITNTSTSVTVYLAIGQDAVVGSGIVLLPGGVYSESISTELRCTQLRISAISSSAATVAIHERIEPYRRARG